MKHSILNIKSIRTDGKVTVISGYANKKIADSIGEIVNPKGVRLTRYEENPMVLFNHDRDYPIGKSRKIELRDMGIWAEIELSTSDNPKITYVTDLIKEGILRTFSIGFEEINTKDLPDGTKEITDLELHEISVVTLPMNYASTFDVIKSKKLNNKLLKKKTFIEGKIEMLHLKGAKVAEMLTAAMAKNPDMPMADMANSCGMSPELMAEVMAGNAEIPADMLPKVAECFDVSLEDLTAANVQDAQNEGIAEGDTQEGCKKPDTTKEDAMQACMAEKIPKLIAEGKPHDQAIAIAISYCSSKGGCELTDKNYKFAVELAAKQAGQDPSSEPTVNVDPGVPNNPDNPLFTMLQSGLSLLGSINTNLIEISKKLDTEITEPTQNPEAANVPSAEPNPQKSVSDLEQNEKMANNIERIFKRLGV